MKDISLKDLLEAGCHFGHKVSKWHPKAKTFIYQSRDGVHIIDLAQTREGIKKSVEYLRRLGEEGKEVLIVATKRQAKGVVIEAAQKAGFQYLTSRWIGGFATNWEEVKKNIDKLNIMRRERKDGSWNQFPKHEIVALEKKLRKIESVYVGVSGAKSLPSALIIIDIKKEIACLREATQKGIPVVGIIDTNTDPDLVDYPIPANDDAVGSIKIIVDYLGDAFLEGRIMAQKKAEKAEKDQKRETEEETKEKSPTEEKKGKEENADIAGKKVVQEKKEVAVVKEDVIKEDKLKVKIQGIKEEKNVKTEAEKTGEKPKKRERPKKEK